MTDLRAADRRSFWRSPGLWAAVALLGFSGILLGLGGMDFVRNKANYLSDVVESPDEAVVRVLTRYDTRFRGFPAIVGTTRPCHPPDAPALDARCSTEARKSRRDYIVELSVSWDSSVHGYRVRVTPDARVGTPTESGAPLP